MTHIAYSELTKRFYFLPEKGKKIDITDDINEILKSQSLPPDSKGNASAENLDHEDWVLGRLYDWLIDPNRKPSITAFTAGSLRKVARQIEYQSADDDLVTDALSCYWRFCKSELQKKDLGDIERKNYESIEKKVRERLKNS
jgi:hypothetical protein